jgi:hypothetical protein
MSSTPSKRMKRSNGIFIARVNDPFKELKKWHLTFEDDFDGVRLDHAKWMTGYYWGKALMNETYVLAGEKQFFKDDNIDLRDSFARITTRGKKRPGEKSGIRFMVF